jgi:hypothetical protein
MRRFAALTILSMLAMPAMALAQDASSPPPPDSQDMQPGMQPPPPDGQYSQPPQGGQYAPPDSPDALPPPAAGGKHHDHDAAMMQKWQQKFDAANTTHDGHLTLAQAQAAGLKPIVAHFAAIDTKNRGYLTFNDVMAWHLDDEAQKMERKAAALRAQD